MPVSRSPAVAVGRDRSLHRGSVGHRPPSESTARLWDVATGTAGRVLEGHRGGVFAVAFSADGATLASAGDDRRVRLWDAATGTAGRVLEGHRGPVGEHGRVQCGRRDVRQRQRRRHGAVVGSARWVVRGVGALRRAGRRAGGDASARRLLSRHKRSGRGGPAAPRRTR